MPGFSEEARRKGQETRARNKAERDARKAAREAAPKRKPTWPPGLAKKQVIAVLRSVIVGTDAALAFGAPQFWVTPTDRLNTKEIDLLAVAMSEEVERHPMALRFLAELTKVGQRAGIIGALLVIATPRLYRRGMLPKFAADLLMQMTESMTGVDDVEQPVGEPEIPQREEPGPDRAAA